MGCGKECQTTIVRYAELVSGIFSFLAIGISVIQLGRHLKNYSNPFFQNKIITILFMAPFYALTSFLTIITRDHVGYFTLIRDIYEAVLIYAFFNLLSSYLAYDGDQKKIDYERIYDMLSNKGVRKHMFPMNYIWKDLLLISKIRGQWFFEGCRLYILQYLAIKPLITFILLIMYLTDTTGGFFSALFQLIVFVSVSYSVYYLVLFYQILKEELAYAKPLLKFLAVKGVLFFTFWQDMVIHILKPRIIALFDDLSEADGELLVSGIGCILICFEMVLLSIITTIAFSYKDFTEIQKKNWLLDTEQGVIGLGKKLISDVVKENFVTTLEDLQDLKNPIKDTLRAFKSGEVKRKGSDQAAIQDNVNKDCHAEIHEHPYVVPEFFVPKEEKNN